MGKIAPSILSADFTRLGEEIQAVERGGADYIHVDVMDGHFVPNITIGPMIVEAARRITDIPLDVHLMISDPDLFIDAFVDAGASILTVHAEAATHLHRTIQRIRDRGIRAGVALNPATGLNALDYVLRDLDMVLLMTVNPGFEGQTFIQAVVPKIEALRNRITQLELNTEIAVDGGISEKNIKMVSSAGADVFVAGSAIYYSEDYQETIGVMRGEMG